MTLSVTKKSEGNMAGMSTEADIVEAIKDKVTMT
jgi:hypothetical protein